MNTWKAVIDFCNINVRNVTERKKLIEYCKEAALFYGFHAGRTTIDTYKNYLIKAELIQNLYVNDRRLRGKFYIPREIRADISISDVKSLAYGDIMQNTFSNGTIERETESIMGSGGSYISPIRVHFSKHYIRESMVRYNKQLQQGKNIGRKKEKDFISKEEMEI